MIRRQMSLISWPLFLGNDDSAGIGDTVHLVSCMSVT